MRWMLLFCRCTSCSLMWLFACAFLVCICCSVYILDTTWKKMFKVYDEQHPMETFILQAADHKLKWNYYTSSSVCNSTFTFYGRWVTSSIWDKLCLKTLALTHLYAKQNMMRLINESGKHGYHATLAWSITVYFAPKYSNNDLLKHIL